MNTASNIVWIAHGSPSVSGSVDCSGRCYVCAQPIQRGVPAGKSIGDNFTDHSRCRAPTGTHVCEGCCYVMSRTSPVLGRPPKEGNKYGGNFRNYSHLWEDGCGYSNASKGEKPAIREFLGREHSAPWFAAIADSGQKHVLMFAPLNGPGRAGLVMFDDQPIVVPESLALVDAMTALLSAGVTKDEIGRGEYYVRTMAERREAVEAFEREHGALRGAGWFSLAIWLAQRDEEEFQRQDAARKAKKDAGRQAKKTARNADGGDAARAPKRVSRRAKRAPADELLGQDPGPHAEQRPPVHVGKRVGDADVAQAPGAEPAQGRLQGFD